MQENVFYVSAREAVNEFFRLECESFPSKLQSQFVGFFSELGKYEEEGVKIRPTIIFTSSIDTIVKSIPNTHKITMFTDVNEVQFNFRMKSLIPFCKQDWTIFVSIKDS